MIFTQEYAVNVLHHLERVSKAILSIYRLKWGDTRTRPWRVSGGPEGVAYHYTGGLSAIKTLRWFLDPSYKNYVSLPHFVILDRMPLEIRSLWEGCPEIAEVFPVPVIQLADLVRGVWCTNWVNDRCVGVEMRNAGFKKYDEDVIRKKRIFVYNQLWEPYTRGQMVSAVRLGQLIRVWRGGAFDPKWVIGHSAIWATKHDPGPLFPLFMVRKEIMADSAVDDWPWLTAYSGDELADYVDDHDDTLGSDYRGDPEGSAEWRVDPQFGDLFGGFSGTVQALNFLGWPVNVARGNEHLVKEFVSYFQRSTLAYEKSAPERVLRVDGVAGPKTIAALKNRISDLRGM
jgi:N-acetyl-anhydromuramyl-L-alanine amidase AmpD